MTQQKSQRISKDYYNNSNPTVLATQNTDSGSYLEIHTLPKLNCQVAENLTRPVTNNEIEFHTSKGLILTLFNFLSILLHVHFKTHITLISARQRYHKNESNGAISSVNTDTDVLKKI